jgi:hypothetical protein
VWRIFIGLPSIARDIGKQKADPSKRFGSRKRLAPLQSANAVVETILRRPAGTPIEVNERQLRGQTGSSSISTVSFCEAPKAADPHGAIEITIRTLVQPN